MERIEVRQPVGADGLGKIAFGGLRAAEGPAAVVIGALHDTKGAEGSHPERNGSSPFDLALHVSFDGLSALDSRGPAAVTVGEPADTRGDNTGDKLETGGYTWSSIGRLDDFTGLAPLDPIA